MLMTHKQHTNGVMETHKRRVSMTISDTINKNLGILSKHYEMPKKYIVKMLVEEKLAQIKCENISNTKEVVA